MRLRTCSLPQGQLPWRWQFTPIAGQLVTMESALPTCRISQLDASMEGDKPLLHDQLKSLIINRQGLSL